MVKIEPNAQNGLSKTSCADCFQIRSVSQQRFIQQIGVIDAAELIEIKEAIKTVLDLGNIVIFKTLSCYVKFVSRNSVPRSIGGTEFRPTMLPKLRLLQLPQALFQLLHMLAVADFDGKPHEHHREH